jgi:pimeloyl-ACP methyl ester carboxylesterase
LISLRGASHIHIAAATDNWYQTPEFAPLISTLADIRSGYDQAILYGGSMGGYGALIFSGGLSATRVIAIAPQFSPDPEKPPFEVRWLSQAQKIKFGNDDMVRMASADADKYIVFDRSHKPDRVHVDLIAQLANVHIINIPFSSHYALTYLNESGVLRESFTALFFEDEPEIKLRTLRRRGRKQSAMYLRELARRLANRGSTRAAFAAASTAYVLGSASSTATDAFLAVLLADREQYDGLIHVLVRLLQREQPSWTHYNSLLDSSWADLQTRAALYSPKVQLLLETGDA